MIILGKKRDELIDALNFSEAMKKLANGEFVHEELEFRCLPLRYSLESEEFSPQELNLIPLWESDLSITGFYLSEGNQPVFIQCYIDEIDEIEHIGSSVEELVNFLIDEYVKLNAAEALRALLLHG